MADALQSVLNERKRQDSLWGEQNHDPALWTSILMEEVGEFSHEVLSHYFGGQSPEKLDLMREELVQVAAVALAMVECIDRGKWKWSE